MENKGNRNNQGKPQWSLVDFPSLEGTVRVLEFGAKKYAPHNWRKGLPTTEICDSLLRHTFAYLNGEDNDPESGLSHVDHIQCNAMFLKHMVQNRPDMDTRYKKEENKLDIELKSAVNIGKAWSKGKDEME
jgi:hypothetical protein